jgi:hypothetical protein
MRIQKCPQVNICKQSVKDYLPYLLHIKRLETLMFYILLNNCTIYIEWKVEKTVNSKFSNKLNMIFLNFQIELKKTKTKNPFGLHYYCGI